MKTLLDQDQDGEFNCAKADQDGNENTSTQTQKEIIANDGNVAHLQRGYLLIKMEMKIHQPKHNLDG